jgi:hypothetical protein
LDHGYEYVEEDLSQEGQSDLVRDPADGYFVDDSKVDTEQKQAMENLEGLLREASHIREASRAGELSDDERRK